MSRSTRQRHWADIYGNRCQSPSWNAPLIRERVVMGLNRARKGGARLGRPRVPVDGAEVARLRAQGRTWAEISLTLGISEMATTPQLDAAGCKFLNFPDADF